MLPPAEGVSCVMMLDAGACRSEVIPTRAQQSRAHVLHFSGTAVLVYRAVVR